jgi:UDP-2,3-diacylglucosamine hydrolase
VPALPSPCHVVSDLHLGAAPREVETQFLAFVRSLTGGGGALVINGDLFDFWFEWRTVIPRVGFRTLAALADLRERGTELLWVAGNHDCWGGDVLREDVGATYHFGPWEGTLAGWRTRIEHGDGLRDEEDRPYRRVRGVLRHRWSIGAFRRLHPDLATRIALGTSHTSRTTRARDGGEGLRQVARAALERAPDLELVIFGHSHVPLLDRASANRAYANAGSWLGEPTYLRITPERVELRRWDGSAEGERLDAIDRAAEEALAKP